MGWVTRNPIPMAMDTQYCICTRMDMKLTGTFASTVIDTEVGLECGGDFGLSKGPHLDLNVK